MPYLGPGVDNGYRSRFIYTATAGQTSFSGGDANGITLTYTDSEYLDVYQNGVLLVPGDDYAATTGTTVVLVQGASLNDKVEMIQYQAFGVADTVSRADGGAFGGNISTSGTLDVTGAITSSAGATITVADNSNTLTLVSTDADANSGPLLDFYRNSGSPADADLIGSMNFRGRNDNSQDVNYGTIIARIEDASDGTEDGRVDFRAIIGGTESTFMKYHVPSGNEIVFNDGSLDIDFRIESDGDANLFFCDGNESIVALGNNASYTVGGFKNKLQVEGTGAVGSSISVTRNTNDANPAYLQFGKSRGTSSGSNTIVQDDDEIAQITFNAADGTNRDTPAASIRAAIDGTPGENDMPGRLTFWTTDDNASSSTQRMVINSSGDVGIGTTAPAAMLNVRRNSGDIAYFQNNAGTGAKITAGNNSFSTVSDENKKENITELTKQDSYDNIKNIKAVNYNYKSVTITNDDGESETIENTQKRLGFIAQDWKTKYPESITTDDDGTLNLHYTDTIAVLLSALQKAQEKIEALEADVKTLKGE